MLKQILERNKRLEQQTSKEGKMQPAVPEKDMVDVDKIIPFLNKYVKVIILICIIILSIYGGRIYGYNQGYTYVQDYYEKKLSYCFCPEQPQPGIIDLEQLEIDIPTTLKAK